MKAKARGKHVAKVNQMLLGSQKTKLRFDHRFIVKGYDPIGKDPLFNHQTHALWHSLKNKAVLLYLDMGTGKTAVALNAIRARQLKGVTKRWLVVCPKIALYSWASDAAKFASDIPIHLAHGTVAEKLVQFKAFKNGIFVINFDSFRLMMQKSIDREPGATLPVYDGMVIDEIHKIKNFKTQKKIKKDDNDEDVQIRVANSGACIGYGRHVEYKMGLTGTPISSSLEDLWVQLTFIDEGNIVDENFYKFRQRYCKLGGWQNKQVVGFQNQSELIHRMAPYTMTVSSEECLDLPPETEHSVLLDMESHQAKIYEIAELEARVALEYLEYGDSDALEGDEGGMTSILTQLLRLRQIAAGVLSAGKGTEEQIHTPKLDAAYEIVEDACSRDEKTVIFTSFIPTIDHLAKKMREFTPIIIKGGMSQTKLFQAIESFQKDEMRPLLIGQTDACNESITLTRGNNSIFYSYDYKSLAFAQAKKRLRRPGQTRRMNHFILQCRGTIDEIVYKRLQEKLAFAGQVKAETKKAEGRRRP